jgi:small subunit ribosomal protein S12
MSNTALRDLKNRRKHLKIKRSPFLNQSHILNAMVVDFCTVEARQPNSAQRKCIKVQILQSKDKRKKTVFVPGCGGIDFIKVHDIVTIQSIGGGSYRAKGDLHGLNYQVIKVNNVSLKEKLLGKK